MSDPTIVEIYLGKGGKAHGPYTAEQLAQIQATPVFATYNYIWDSRDAFPAWKPLAKDGVASDGPGAPPPDEHHPAVVAAALAAAKAQTQQAETRLASAAPDREPARPVVRGYDVPGLEALCHDSRTVIAGKITQVTDAGCELVCSQEGTVPAFGTQSRVILNILDPQSGRAMNVSARLSALRRQGGAWVLKLRWNGCPELVEEQADAAG